MAENGVTTVSNNPTGSIFNKAFLSGAAERAIKTGAQSAVVFLGASFITGDQLNVLTVDWLTMLGFFLGGVVVSFLTSVANPQFVAGSQALVRVPDAAAAAAPTGSTTYVPKHSAETQVGGV